MTTATFARPFAARRLSAGPADGWLTLGLVMLLCLSLAWSLDDAVLVIGNGDLTDFLAWMAVGGVLSGFLGPAVGWRRWTSHLFGALFAVLTTFLVVGTILVVDADSLTALFQATSDAAVSAWNDLIVLDRPTTREHGHHLLVLGLLVWGSAMFASYAAFGHRRPLNAILLIGGFLVANMALSEGPTQLWYLVLYSLAALFLLIRFHTLDEQADWTRRRIGDPGALAGLYLRGGTVFIVGAVALSLALTTVAASAPLAPMWTDVAGRMIEWSQAIERFLPQGQFGRSVGPSFDGTAPIRGSWSTNSGLALTVQMSPDEVAAPYLVAVVYDTFDQTGWKVATVDGLQLATGANVLEGLAEEPDAATRRDLVVSISSNTARSEVFTPYAPDQFTMAVRAEVIGGPTGFLARLRQEATSGTYRVTGSVPAAEADGGPTANRLRAAGQGYPEAVVALYGRPTVDPGTLGPNARALLDTVLAEAGTNPYDIAATMEAHLRDPDNFQYDTDVLNLDCSTISAVECFATYKAGYCEYYASTMAVLLREAGIPTRYVQGFRAGDLDPLTGAITYRNSDAHAWVQVYFPGYGWIDFDPTGGDVPRLTPLPSGQPVASATPGPSSSASGGAVIPSIPRDIDEPGGSAPPGSEDYRAALIAVAGMVALVIGAIALAAFRRGPRGPVSADGAYGMVTRMAGRFGFAPRPEQTVYEYAGALAEILPNARPELETVAQARVETVYGGHVLPGDRLSGLAEAQRRLRTSLLRLAFRRDQRPGVRRRRR